MVRSIVFPAPGCFRRRVLTGLGRLCRGDSAHGLGRGTGAAAVLLPQPSCRMVSREPNPLGGMPIPAISSPNHLPRTCHFPGGVCRETLSFSLSGAQLGGWVVGEGPHTPGLLTGSPSLHTTPWQ